MAQPPSDLIAKIARDKLGIRTLEQRHSDHLDFHELAVWSVQEALQAAFDAGVQSVKGEVIARLRTALEGIQAHDRKLDDPNGDGSGNDAESPTGDDYNELCSIIQPLFDMLGLRGPMSPHT